MSALVGDRSFQAALSDDTAELVTSAGTRRRYRRGSFLFHEGDAPRHVYLLQSGLVKIQTHAADGHVSVLGFRERGALLGEQSTLDGKPMSASAVALTPTEAVVIASSRFRMMLETHIDLDLALLHQMNRRLRASSKLIKELATADAVTRVANRIIDLTGSEGEDPGHTVSVSQQDLADWAGLSREAVVRSLRVLRDEGLITTGRMAVAVTDVAGLQRRALLHEER